MVLVEILMRVLITRGGIVVDVVEAAVFIVKEVIIGPLVVAM